MRLPTAPWRALALLLLVPGARAYAKCEQGPSWVVTWPADTSGERLLGSIFFCPDDTQLDSDDKQQLGRLKDYLERLKTHQMRFGYAGFADVTKGKTPNLMLAYRRAEAVARHVGSSSGAGLATELNYHALPLLSWGDEKSDPEFHMAWRRVDIWGQVVQEEKPETVDDAIERSRGVLGSSSGEAENRLRCLLNKLEDSDVGDLFFLKTLILSADPGGIPPNRYPDLCDPARGRVLEAAAKKHEDAQVLAGLRSLDHDVLDARAYVNGTSSEGAAESKTYTQIRQTICLLSESKTHIYSCYGECE